MPKKPTKRTKLKRPTKTLYRVIAEARFFVRAENEATAAKIASRSVYEAVRTCDIDYDFMTWNGKPQLEVFE